MLNPTDRGFHVFLMLVENMNMNIKYKIWNIKAKNCKKDFYLIESQGPSPRVQSKNRAIFSEQILVYGCHLSQKQSSMNQYLSKPKILARRPVSVVETLSSWTALISKQNCPLFLHFQWYSPLVQSTSGHPYKNPGSPVTNSNSGFPLQHRDQSTLVYFEILLGTLRYF